MKMSDVQLEPPFRPIKVQNADDSKYVPLMRETQHQTGFSAVKVQEQQASMPAPSAPVIPTASVAPTQLQGTYDESKAGTRAPTTNFDAEASRDHEFVPSREFRVEQAVLVPMNNSSLSVVDAYLLHITLGFFGALHFRMGRPGLGFLYLFTVGGFGFGWLVDLFRIPQLVKDYNDKQGRLNGHESKITLIGDCYALWVLNLFGAVHFYLGRPSTGTFYFFTVGGFGLGFLLDTVRIPFLVDDYMREKKGDYQAPKLAKFDLGDAYVTWLPPAGLFGIHHLYLKDYRMFTFYFFTLGLFGLGWLVDGFRMPFLVRRANARSSFNLPDATIA